MYFKFARLKLVINLDMQKIKKLDCVANKKRYLKIQHNGLKNLEQGNRKQKLNSHFGVSETEVVQHVSPDPGGGGGGERHDGDVPVSVS